MKCQFTSESVALGVRSGTGRWGPDQFHAADSVFVEEIVLFKLCVCACALVRMCVFMHKNGSNSVSGPDPLWEWINFSPQDCQSNITAKTKLKKKKICSEEALECLIVFFVTFIKFWT